MYVLMMDNGATYFIQCIVFSFSSSSRLTVETFLKHVPERAGDG